jgi:hypothetical protein
VFEYVIFFCENQHGAFPEILGYHNNMRRAKNPQFKLGEIPIADIKIDLKSRDDIPQLLLGLQYIYTHPELRGAFFSLLQEVIVPNTDSNNGRPGMEQWKIFVLGVLRLNLNCDYDRIHELANNHKTIRQMLGHATFADEHEYKLQTVKDNVALLTPELLDRILLSICSFDKGFHSPRNQTELTELLDYVVLPQKGRLSRKDKDREHSKEFVKTRYQHAAVESAINALEVHGLDRCPDHGLHGLNRYVSLSVLSRNIQLAGVAIKKQQRATQKDKEKLELAA